MRPRIWIICGFVVLSVLQGRAETGKSEYLWTLRQASSDGRYRSCSLIRFSEDRDGAEGKLFAGQIDGLDSVYVGDTGPLDVEEAERRRKGQRYVDEIPDDVEWLQVFCTLQHADSAGPSGMSCKGIAFDGFPPSGGEARTVTFSAQGRVTRKKFGGLWRNASGSATGSFTMELRGERCSATVQWWMDGMRLWQRPPVTYDSMLRERLRLPASVREVLQRVGPGYMPHLSGTGTVFWRFNDGLQLCTKGYPDSLKAWVYSCR